jgi:hypothetical protein
LDDVCNHHCLFYQFLYEFPLGMKKDVALSYVFFCY